MQVIMASQQHGAGHMLALVPVTNEAPAIDGKDEYLGAFDVALTKQYTVTDIEGDGVTINEKLNGVLIRSRNAAGTHTLDLSLQWDALTLGKHTITIEANDIYVNPPHQPTIRTWTFTKLLPIKPKTPQIVSGLGDVVAKFTAYKNALAAKVGGVPGDTLEELIAKLGTMKKYVSGTVMGSADVRVFEYANGGGTTNTYYATVNDLPFKPAVILFKGAKGAYDYRLVYTEKHPAGSLYKVPTVMYAESTGSTTGAGIQFKGHTQSAIVTDKMFTLPVGISGITWEWEAWG
ncbi:hypothetical protein [Lysinibacillus sp. 54212]|uniref:hypothetical protein n=1 Tax=Lysinibacillus sp. 54212 TaxID=3119829 RepID=UPI002FCC82D8